MTMSRWDPFNEMMSLRQAMNSLLEDAWIRPGRALAGEGVHAPLDVAESDQDLTVKVVLPGVKPEDLDITVIGNVLTIKAESREESEDKQQNWHRKEIRYGKFHRTLELPTAVESDHADASFENGVLTLKLPKAEAAKPKSIKVSPRQEALEGGSN
jgi:HSP20 family protein